MPKTKQQKNEMVDMYKQKLKEADAVYFIEAQGIKASDATTIKKNLFDLDASFNVVKNSLFDIALKDAGLEKPAAVVEGQYAVIFATEDKASEAAKVIYDFLDEKKKELTVEIKGGILNTKVLSKSEVIELANLPSREVMLAKVLGTMNAPISGFVIALSGNIKNFINVINAIKDQKSE